jgi:hypothetical protein
MCCLATNRRFSSWCVSSTICPLCPVSCSSRRSRRLGDRAVARGRATDPGTFRITPGSSPPTHGRRPNKRTVTRSPCGDDRGRLAASTGGQARTASPTRDKHLVRAGTFPQRFLMACRNAISTSATIGTKVHRCEGRGIRTLAPGCSTPGGASRVSDGRVLSPNPRSSVATTEPNTPSDM